MSNGPGEFDLNAAWLRRAEGDSKAFLEALAVRLEGALPGRVTIERRRDGLFAKTSHVESVLVELEQNAYRLVMERAQLRAHRTKVVHGVTLRSEVLPVAEWMGGLRRDLALVAGHAENAQQVLHEFLMS